MNALFSIIFVTFALLLAGMGHCAGAAPQSTVAAPIGDKWAVVIGISKFADSDVPTLRFAAKDATDFYNFLTDPTAGRFARNHVRLLTDENATKENILDAIGDSFLPHAALPEDLVVIYISTHGSPAGADIRGVNYIVAHDTKVRKLFSSGIEMQDLVRKIKERVHTNRIVLILDTCFSGATSDTGHKGLTRTNVSGNQVAQGIGSIVICSSAPDQRSWESDALNNSYFTKHLINALRKNQGKVPLQDAFFTMREQVRSDVLHDKGMLQTPELSGKFVGPKLVLGLQPTVTRRAPAGAEEAPKLVGYLDRDAVVNYRQFASQYDKLHQIQKQLNDLTDRANAKYAEMQARRAPQFELESYRASKKAEIDTETARFTELLSSIERENESRIDKAVAEEAAAQHVAKVVYEKPPAGTFVDLTPGVKKRLQAASGH